MYTYSYLLNNLTPILTTARTIPNNALVQNPVVSNQGTIASTSIIISTEMTNDRRPSVKIVIGNVKTRSKVPTSPLTIAKTTATTIATRTGSILTHGTIHAVIPIARALMRMFRRRFIVIRKTKVKLSLQQLFSDLLD